MKPNNSPFTLAGARLIASAALAASLIFVPGAVFAAATSDAHADRAEQRIKDMHSKLKITATQEEQWNKVALIMSDNAKAMDTLTQARKDHAKEMTAVDDLKSYGEIAEAHADGIKKLTPVFATLYDGMSEAQKKEADTLFRHGDRRHGHMKHQGK